MKVSHFVMIALASHVSSACGDIIRAPNPFEKEYPRERKIEVYDETYGNCPSFNGDWNGQCTTADGTTQAYRLVIHHGGCRTFTVDNKYPFDTHIPRDLNVFVDDTLTRVTSTVSWSEERKKLHLNLNEYLTAGIRKTDYELERVDWDHLRVNVTKTQGNAQPESLTCSLVWSAQRS